MMKKIIFLWLLLSWQLQATECTVTDIVFTPSEGIPDWDSKTDKLVLRYPPIKYFGEGGELHDKIKAQFKIKGECQKLDQVEVALSVYAYRGPYRMSGGDDAHDRHGEGPVGGVWVDKPVLEQTIKVKKERFENIEMDSIEMAPLWKMPGEFFWFWSYRFEFKIQNEGKTLGTTTTEIKAPLMH